MKDRFNSLDSGQPTSRHIMVALLGADTWVITQALYCLAVEQKLPISQLVIVSTKNAESTLYKNNRLLGDQGELRHLCTDYSIAEPEIRIVRIEDEQGNRLDDIRTVRDCEVAAYSMLNMIRNLSADSINHTHCVFAGARRLMVSYLMSALSMVGLVNDHFYYVLMTPEEAGYSRSFFYKPKKPYLIDLPSGRRSTDSITVETIEIPFPRLGEKYSAVIKNDRTYREVLLHVQSYISNEQKPIVRSGGSEPVIVGSSPKLRVAMDMVRKFAQAGLDPVLLYGETGTGKELFAEYYDYHYTSQFENKPALTRINCGAIPSELIESELFGHKKGAHSTATADKPGWLQEADGGVAFLDEINSTSLSLQAKLLRFLESGEMQILGAQRKDTKGRSNKVTVKVVVGLNEEPERLVEAGQMREDFFYRITKGKVIIPPLRERKEDLGELIDYLFRLACAEYKKTNLELSDRVKEQLSQFPWYGNVRALKYYIERLVVLAEPLTQISELTELPDEPVKLARSFESRISELVSVVLDEKRGCDEVVNLLHETLLSQAYSRNGLNTEKTAQVLGLKRSTLQERLKRYRIGEGERRKPGEPAG